MYSPSFHTRFHLLTMRLLSPIVVGTIGFERAVVEFEVRVDNICLTLYMLIIVICYKYWNHMRGMNDSYARSRVAQGRAGRCVCARRFHITCTAAGT